MSRTVVNRRVEASEPMTKAIKVSILKSVRVCVCIGGSRAVKPQESLYWTEIGGIPFTRHLGPSGRCLIRLGMSNIFESSLSQTPSMTTFYRLPSVEILRAHRWWLDHDRSAGDWHRHHSRLSTIVCARNLLPSM